MQRLIGSGAFLDKDLHECAGFRRAFPRQAALAGGQLDRDIADALGLAGFQHHVLGEIGALVEQSQSRDAVLHRGAVFAFHHGPGHGLAGGFLGYFGGLGIGSALPLAGSQQQRKGKQDGLAAHQASGDQASYAPSLRPPVLLCCGRCALGVPVGLGV